MAECGDTITQEKVPTGERSITYQETQEPDLSQ